MLDDVHLSLHTFYAGITAKGMIIFHIIFITHIMMNDVLPQNLQMIHQQTAQNKEKVPNG